MPEISVIIPCYNTNQKLLINCIKSVINQTFKNFEILIVDDGSSDEYRHIYEKICKMDSRIKIIYKENGGVSSARNLGVRQAAGRYIIFVDSDDILIECFFEEAYKIIRSEGADIVFGCNVHLQNYEQLKDSLQESKIEIVSLIGNQIQQMKSYMVGQRMRFQNGMIYIGRGPWTRILKRTLAIDIPFNSSLDICEDIVWNLQILNKSQKVCYVKKAWYIYNMHQDSAVRKYDSSAIKKTMDGLNSVKECLDFTSDEEYKAYADRCFEDMIRIYGNALEVENSVPSELSNKFCTEGLWNIVTEKRYWTLSNGKTKIKIILYKSRLLFLAIKIKKFILSLQIKSQAENCEL